MDELKAGVEYWMIYGGLIVFSLVTVGYCVYNVARQVLERHENRKRKANKLETTCMEATEQR